MKNTLKTVGSAVTLSAAMLAAPVAEAANKYKVEVGKQCAELA